MDWKHSPHLLPEKTFMLILWLGSCSNAHAMHPRGDGVWEEQAQLLEEILPVQIVMDWAGWGGRNAQPSPPPEGLFSWGKKKRLPWVFIFCLPGGSWNSFHSLYLSFSIYNKLIQLLLLLKWRLSSPGRLFKRSWRHPESHTTFYPHICAVFISPTGSEWKDSHNYKLLCMKRPTLVSPVPISWGTAEWFQLIHAAHRHCILSALPL